MVNDRPSNSRRAIFLSLLLGASSMLVVAGIVHSPGEAFRASLSGLQVWWQNVFPGLLPPIMLAELLAASGLLHGLAALAEPLTRGLFRLPGAAGWAIAFGWSAGIPAGAKETARLRDNGLIRDDDVDTALLVSHVPNPFLVVLVIGFGFLHSPALGWAIAVGLWLAAILSGIVWSRVAKPRVPRVPVLPATQPRALLIRAVRAAADARKEDGRPLGKLLADSVTGAVATLMTVGGLMMMSAVIVRLLQLFLPGNDLWLQFPGLYELHLGAYESGKSALFVSDPARACALLAAALAWTGWSGLLQARAAFGLNAPFPWLRIVSSRLLHSAAALLIVYPLAKLVLSEKLRIAERWPVPSANAEAWTASAGVLPNGWSRLSENVTVALASLGVFLMLALLAALIRPKTPTDRDESGKR